jgi:putative FmdB family regulatory protein
MPIYEYRCENGHTFEVMQKMTDDPVSVCSTCEAPVQRVFHPVAVHFKGKGFYNTDYGTKRRNRELERSGKSGADKTESGSSSSSSEGSSGSGGSDSGSSGSGSGSGSGDSGSSSKSSSSSSGSSSSKPAGKD